jgi:uncharacterized protein (TIGR02594 family)
MKITYEVVDCKERHFRNVCLAITMAIILGAILLTIVAVARADIISIAQSQIGLGEIGGNNKGIHVCQYLNGQDNLPWCAGFVSYCIKKSGFNILYTLRAKDFLKLGYKATKPKPGDIVVFTRKGGGHTGIIEKVSKNTFVSIEGNVGEYPSKVKRIKHNLADKNILNFIRLTKS